MKFTVNGRKYRTTSKTTDIFGMLIFGGFMAAMIIDIVFNLETLSTIL